MHAVQETSQLAVMVCAGCVSCREQGGPGEVGRLWEGHCLCASSADKAGELCCEVIRPDGPNDRQMG